MDSILLLGCVSIPFLAFGRRIFPYLFKRTILQKQQNVKASKAKKFVIVSGATDGIGKQYIKYLTQNYNYNIVALGRNEKKLQQLVAQSEVKSEQKYKLNFVLPFRIDFSEKLSYQKSVSQITRKIVEQYQIIESLSTGVYNQNQQNEAKAIEEIYDKFAGVINCCGISMFQQFNSLKTDQIVTINNTNINSTIFSLKLLSFFNQKILQNRESQKCNFEPSFFINISSLTATKNLKLLSIYAATKSYQQRLIANYAQQNVDPSKIRILNLQPWYVKTKMTNFMNTWDSIQSSQLVQNSFSLIFWGKTNAIGSIKHQAIDYIFPLLKGYFVKRSKTNFQKMKKMKQLLAKRRNK